MIRTALWVGGAIATAALLFAPIIHVGFCADAPGAEASSCETWSRSVVGIDTSGWLWLGATVALSALAWWLSRAHRRGADD